jgi:hypothetical protein
VHAPTLSAGPYFAAVRQYGSPVPGASTIDRESEGDKERTDSVLVQALGISARPAGTPLPGPPLGVEQANAGRAQTSAPCVVFRPTGPGAFLDVAVPGAGLLIAAHQRPTEPIKIALRRFAAAFSAPALTAPGEGRSVLLLPRRHYPGRAWHARLFLTNRGEVCALRPRGA